MRRSARYSRPSAKQFRALVGRRLLGMEDCDLMICDRFPVPMAGSPVLATGDWWTF